jgi:UDP-2,3-diacylglucosamine pyrophosphatase LpxH
MERTLIVSDIHLGACNSEGQALLALLESPFDRLILNGDLVDHVNFHRFRRVDWDVIARMQSIARKQELVFIRGNHEASRSRGDPGPINLLARLVGTDICEEYELDVGYRRYLVLHGDQFDDTLNLTRIGNMADSCYRVLQRCSRSVAGWAKHGVKRWSGVVKGVRRRAVARGRCDGYDGVIVGHTHFSHDGMVDDVHYLNTGCWVDRPCTYVTVDGGAAELCSWPQHASPRFSLPQRVLPMGSPCSADVQNLRAPRRFSSSPPLNKGGLGGVADCLAATPTTAAES